jgi:hypothetical protein
VTTTIHPAGTPVTAVTPDGYTIVGHVDSHRQINEFGDVTYIIQINKTVTTFTATPDKVRVLFPPDGPMCVNCGVRRAPHGTVSDHPWNGGGSA